jgi:hypothetical protein
MIKTSTCSSHHLALPIYATMQTICKVIMDERDEAYTPSPNFAGEALKTHQKARQFGATTHD